MSAWVTVSRGQYVQGVDAAVRAGYPLLDAPHYLAFDLTAEDGAPAVGDYRGPGQLVRREDGATWLVLGDPARATHLPAYRVADAPTADSEAALAMFVDGFRARMTGRRRKATADHAWREGYAEAARLTNPRAKRM